MDFKAEFGGENLLFYGECGGTWQKQPGCHSEGLAQKGPRPQITLSPWDCCPSHHPPHVLTCATAEVQGLVLGYVREEEAHAVHARSISVPCLWVSTRPSMDHQHNCPSPHPQPRSTTSLLVNSSSMGTGCSQRLQQMERSLWMWKRMWITGWYLEQESDTLQGSVDRGKGSAGIKGGLP